MSEWQPIETAPEQTGWILLWCSKGSATSGSLGVGFRDFKTRTDDGKQLPVDDWHWSVHSYSPLAFEPPMTFSGEAGCERSANMTPTHWMPLPDPPTNLTGGK